MAIEIKDQTSCEIPTDDYMGTVIVISAFSGAESIEYDGEIVWKLPPLWRRWLNWILHKPDIAIIRLNR